MYAAVFLHYVKRRTLQCFMSAQAAALCLQRFDLTGSHRPLWLRVGLTWVVNTTDICIKPYSCDDGRRSDDSLTKYVSELFQIKDQNLFLNFKFFFSPFYSAILFT